MKPVFIAFSNEQGKKTKTYTTCSLKTGLLDSIFELAERAEELKNETSGMKEAREFFRDLKAIIVTAFGRQFTYDELNEGVESEELMKVFQNLCANAMGGIKKN